MSYETTLNQMMKNHKPWTVGFATRRSANSIFFPIFYKKQENRWYGYIRQTTKLGIEEVPAWRKGTRTKYMIKKVLQKKLPRNHHVHLWLKEYFPKRSSK